MSKINRKTNRPTEGKEGDLRENTNHKSVVQPLCITVDDIQLPKTTPLIFTELVGGEEHGLRKKIFWGK